MFLITLLKSENHVLFTIVNLLGKISGLCDTKGTGRSLPHRPAIHLTGVRVLFLRSFPAS